MLHNTAKVLTKITAWPPSPSLSRTLFTAVDYVVELATVSAKICKEESLPPRDETLLPYSYRTLTKNTPRMSVELQTRTSDKRPALGNTRS